MNQRTHVICATNDPDKAVILEYLEIEEADCATVDGNLVFHLVADGENKHRR